MPTQEETSFEPETGGDRVAGVIRRLLYPGNKRPGHLVSLFLPLGGLALMLAVGLSDPLDNASRAAIGPGPTLEAVSDTKKALSVVETDPGPQLIIPETEPNPLPASIAEPFSGVEVVKATVRRGDTLVDLLKRNRVGNQEAHNAVAALKGHFNLKKLQVGQSVEVSIDANTDPKAVLQHLRLRTAFDQEIILEKGSDGAFQAKKQTIPTLELTMYHSGTIEDSLYLSANAAGVPDAIIVEMIRLLSFDVDFQREIRRGNQFEVYYRRRAANGGQEIENGDILYAALTLKKRPLRYFRYRDGAGGRVDYFDEKGQSARRALMKTPVDGARLSSNYGRRKHPILGYTRMHKGADFAANWGTPIMAAGDGVIEMSQRNGGYGNYVRIRHNGTYSTAYAHLSKYGKGIRKGKRVTQGQIIGYIGATGLAKGAHLHYEVMVNGKQINPMTLKLPNGRKLANRELERYMLLKADLEADLSALRTVDALRAAAIVDPAGPDSLPGS